MEANLCLGKKERASVFATSSCPRTCFGWSHSPVPTSLQKYVQTSVRLTLPYGVLRKVVIASPRLGNAHVSCQLPVSGRVYPLSTLTPWFPGLESEDLRVTWPSESGAAREIAMPSPGPHADEVHAYTMPMTTSPARSDASDNGLARPSRHKDRFSQEHEGHLLGKTRAVSASPLKLSMSHTSLEHLISSAMRHLPVPVLVLNNSKTVVYANEAIGTLLGIARHAKDDNYEDFSDVQIRLRGQTLCQVGVDMLQDGRLMWVSWDAFFDSIAKELRVNSGGKRGGPGMQTHSPSPASHSTNDASDVHGRDVPTLASSPTRDVAVDVVICGNDLTRMSGDPTEVVGAYEHQVHATMIVSAWEFADHQAYFTLTFTSSPPAPVSLDEMGHGSALGTAEPRSRSSSQASLALTSDASVLKSTQFPPAGPPSKSVKNAPLSHLQKLTKMKDFLLNSTQVPVLAMWKDGSAVFPNRASRKLCRQDISFDDTLKGRASLLNWDTYSEDFSRKLSLDEHPISVLLRTEEPFESMRIGFYDRSGRRFICDARGELIRDETGEVFAGLVSLTDVTRFTEEILELRELSEERFKQICNTMPQLVWTTTADAKFDFFNIRWYEYTGLTFDLSVGDRWTTVLHPDDRAAVFEKWEYCIKTGEAYAADYRVRSRNGDYRWFLARANPLRDREMGQIVKWFGTFNTTCPIPKRPLSPLGVTWRPAANWLIKAHPPMSMRRWKPVLQQSG